jgi:hypothetical protein
MNGYLDSSAIIRFLTQTPEFFREFSEPQVFATAEITEIECFRTFDKLRLMGELSDDELIVAKEDLKDLLASADIIQMDHEVLTAAKAPYSMVIRSLDAIHIATALEWQRELKEPVTIFSHDKRMNQLARYVGLETAEKG